MTIGFAHRGARTEHRDNTLPGFARALQLGATGLESDAWVTADGVPVLDHDGLVRRGLRRRAIAGLRRDDLPRHIPTLAELLALPGADRVHLSLDIKDPRAAAAVLGVAGADRRRLWLCSPELPALLQWRAGDDRVRLVHSTGRARLASPVEHPARLAADGVDALNLRAGEWDAELVEACHSAGVSAFGWDAQKRDELERLVGLGLDGVYSDHVATMVAVVGSEQLDAGDRPDPQHRPADDEVAGDGPDVP